MRAEESGTVLGEYTYNGLGQRIIKAAGGTTTVFLYDFDGNIIAETDQTGSILTEYLYKGSSRLAMVDVLAGKMYYYGNDKLGTPQILTDATNTVVWEADYKPFGEADVNPNSTVVNNFRFPGQYYDIETGLHYNYHRYYDPKTGRYITADPIGLNGGINLFIYVDVNPVNVIDPFGLEFIYDKSEQKLYWIEGAFESDTPEVLKWHAVTGPYGNGPLPNGWYYLTGEETPINSESNSMTDTCGNKYKYRLHPQFNTNRSGLLIHPDGGVPGTAGCIGGTGCTTSLRDFINFHLDKPSGRGNPNSNATLPVYVRE